ncbi:SDR family oxidoreductase [Streptomyces sp. KM273126]|uniref:SDR family NAD(P)-dependent oxidoreductase n=1 Tax=Streptomyces sp. KM273126 TaxID=2545247 RepID=UPI00103D8B58|nr:SDR family oxidoreductase [Streptomyces sp. KM273126]MBA2810841.1 SDR family oxidoreductase [Streptomyces sp. KM273126]
MNDFHGVGAIVTGGTGGIGGATATLLRERGARVAVLDLRIDDAPDGVHAVRCDITDPVAVDEAVATAVDRLGSLDVLVNNAGIGAVGDIAQNDDAEWARVLDVNVTGIARVTRAALPHLLRSPHPAIVNTCSAVAYVGVRQRALYSASKGAVHALTLAMAADHAADGIRVNAVAPGTADTPWVARLLEGTDDPDTAARDLRARQPLGRLVTAEEVADAIVSLASPTAGATTGTILRVDGGMTSLRL